MKLLELPSSQIISGLSGERLYRSIDSTKLEIITHSLRSDSLHEFNSSRDLEIEISAKDYDVIRNNRAIPVQCST